jgi:hypothetical protein
VIAQDVTQDYLKQLAERIKRQKVSNVASRLANPRPAPACLFARCSYPRTMYNEAAQPYAFLCNLARP